MSSGVQPSPYCMYKFFDFNDYDTRIVTGSNDPHLNDLKTYPVEMTSDLDRYLKAQVCRNFFHLALITSYHSKIVSCCIQSCNINLQTLCNQLNVITAPDVHGKCNIFYSAEYSMSCIF